MDRSVRVTISRELVSFAVEPAGEKAGLDDFELLLGRSKYVSQL
jgi:hypothetical protein